MKLTPQQNQILEFLRDGDWHCQTQWLDSIKDDRKRISELNNDGKNGKPVGYMYERGYEIKGVPCDGRCGKTHPSRLYMRKAVKLDPIQAQNEWFDKLPV